MKSNLLILIGLLFSAFLVFSFHTLSDEFKPRRPSLTNGSTLKKIVSTSPAITEILFAIGVGDRIIGVTDYCTFPPDAKTITKIGGIVKPSLETVLSLKPDLIVLGNMVAWMQPEFERAQIPTFQIYTYTVPQILNSINALGERIDVTARANELLTDLTSEIETVKAQVLDGRKKRVMIVVGRTPGTLTDIYVVGQGSFLNELLTFAGGENIFSDVALQYPKISKEEIIARAPEIIIESAHGGKLNAEIEAEMIEAWQPLSSLPAVKNGKIYILNDDYLLVPGPRLTQSLRKFKSILHPEMLGE